jgi:hypothetical protein
MSHDVNTGYKWMALTAASGTPAEGTSRQWNMRWCYSSGTLLRIGDFDGNGTSDLLCHGISRGEKWIARQFP